uniref:Antitoxin VbhA domain-containing protein n=1 Tax=uncultured prokaryote TaxID=198431 RepID=A0A0H5Q0S0_9ZZZZ|nr:hypothetical protein [uncultured prokaryote]
MTDEEKEKNIKAMRYAIHSNELEGYIYTDEEKEILFKITTGELTVDEALKIFKIH